MTTTFLSGCGITPSSDPIMALEPHILRLAVPGPAGIVIVEDAVRSCDTLPRRQAFALVDDVTCPTAGGGVAAVRDENARQLGTLRASRPATTLAQTSRRAMPSSHRVPRRRARSRTGASISSATSRRQRMSTCSACELQSRGSSPTCATRSENRALTVFAAYRRPPSRGESCSVAATAASANGKLVWAPQHRAWHGHPPQRH